LGVPMASPVPKRVIFIQSPGYEKQSGSIQNASHAATLLL